MLLHTAEKNIYLRSRAVCYLLPHTSHSYCSQFHGCHVTALTGPLVTLLSNTKQYSLKSELRVSAQEVHYQALCKI